MAPLDTAGKPEVKPETKPDPDSTNMLSLVGLKKNAVAPLVNSFAIEPVNTGLNVINCASDVITYGVNKISGQHYAAPQTGKLDTMDVAKPTEGTAAAYSQQIFGTAGSFLVYAVASKVAGKVLRTAGEAAPLELSIGNFKAGSAIRAIAQDSRVATVVGATTYAGFKDTKDGETHFSNAASTFVGFTAFEAGNSRLTLGAGRLQTFGERYAVGAFGGIAQANVASLITAHKFAGADADKAAALSGGFLNALMPAGKAITDHAIENPIVRGLPHANEAVARMHIDAVRELRTQPAGTKPEPGSWADPAARNALEKAARADLHIKIKADDAGPTRIDQKNNVIYVGKDAQPIDVLQEFGHRPIFKDPAYQERFAAIARDIKSPNPADPANAPVKENYVQARVDQEIAARTFQNEEAARLGVARRASVDGNEIRREDNGAYQARFEAEADKFIASGGKDPGTIIDHNGAGGHGGGSGHSDAGHVVNSVSNAHAANNHGTEAHQDGPGAGNGTRADGSRETTLSPEQQARRAATFDLRDWPPADKTGTNFEEPSSDYPRGREYSWFNWRAGAEVNGHQDVVWAKRYDVHGDAAELVKRDPRTNELSAVRLRNDGVEEIHADGRDDTIHTTSVERIYDLSASKTPLDQLFDSDVGLRAIKYEVSQGNDLIPSNTTYTRYSEPRQAIVNNERIYPTATVEYHDGSGRIDFHQDYPFQNVISRWPEPLEENGVRYQVSVPQSIEGSHRLFRLTADNRPDGITDVFSEDHPLDTDFGKVLRVDRQGDKDTYHLEDGSVVVAAHYNGNLVKLHIVDGVSVPEDVKIYKGDDGYSEKYTPYWETVFGQAKEVKIGPEKATYTLANDGTVELFKQPRTIDTFDNVDWVYNDPSGDKVLQLADGAQTRIRIPFDGADTGVMGAAKAVGEEQITGSGAFTRYHMSNGQIMDVLPDQPGIGIIREPGTVTWIGQGPDGGWKSVKTIFEKDQFPVMIERSANSKPLRTVLTRDQIADFENQPVDLMPEIYRNGLMTKWGLALERHTYWTGHSKLKIADGSKEGYMEIELNANGDRVIRDKNQKITKIIPEPKAFPHLRDITSPRRIVSARDFPDPNQPRTEDGGLPEEEVNNEDPNGPAGYDGHDHFAADDLLNNGGGLYDPTE